MPRPRRSVTALLPGALASAALVAAPFAGTTTGPLTAHSRPTACTPPDDATLRSAALLIGSGLVPSVAAAAPWAAGTDG